MNIAIVIPSLAAGGAERVASSLAKEWISKGHMVTVLTWDSKNSRPFFKLPPSVSHVSLDIAGPSVNLIASVLATIKRIMILRRYITRLKPDVVVSFMDRTNITVLLSLIGTRFPVVIADRNDPGKWPKETLWKLLRDFTYPFSDKIVVQTELAKEYFGRKKLNQIVVIPNPIFKPPLVSVLPVANSKMKIISVGQLDMRKGFDVLLRALALVAEKHLDFQCLIFGDGVERQQLEWLRDSLGLQGKVQFLGQQENLAPLLRQADIFVLPSRFEGFPNALCEAMACGLPAIASATMGARAIIRDGVDGQLVAVDDAQALANAIGDSIINEPKRKKWGLRAVEVLERFHPDVILGLWDDVLYSVEKRI